MRFQSAATKSLFSNSEVAEIVQTENKLLFDAKNGNFSPLLEFWSDKKARMLKRSDDIAVRTEYWGRKTGIAS